VGAAGALSLAHGRRHPRWAGPQGQARQPSQPVPGEDDGGERGAGADGRKRRRASRRRQRRSDERGGGEDGVAPDEAGPDPARRDRAEARAGRALVPAAEPLDADCEPGEEHRCGDQPGLRGGDDEEHGAALDRRQADEQREAETAAAADLDGEDAPRGAVERLPGDGRDKQGRDHGRGDETPRSRRHAASVPVAAGRRKRPLPAPARRRPRPRRPAGRAPDTLPP